MNAHKSFRNDVLLLALLLPSFVVQKHFKLRPSNTESLTATTLFLEIVTMSMQFIAVVDCIVVFHSRMQISVEGWSSMFLFP